MTVQGFLAAADSAFQSIATYLNAIVIALAILLGGFIVARIVGMALTKIFTAARFDDRLSKALKRRRQYARATRTTIVRLLYLATAWLALESLRIAGAVLTFVFGLLVLIMLASIVLAALEVLPNLLARSRLQARHINVGSEIVVHHASGDVAGKVVEMNLLEVQIRRPGGDIVFFPNASLLGVRITKRRQKRS